MTKRKKKERVTNWKPKGKQENAALHPKIKRKSKTREEMKNNSGPKNKKETAEARRLDHPKQLGQPPNEK